MSRVDQFMTNFLIELLLPTQSTMLYIAVAFLCSNLKFGKVGHMQRCYIAEAIFI